MNKKILFLLLFWTFFAIQCGQDLDRYETQSYHLEPAGRIYPSEEYRNTFSAEYGAYVLGRLLYNREESLQEAGRKQFLSPESSNGTVTLRDTRLNHLRIQTYLKSIQGDAIKPQQLEQDQVYAFRIRLFETPGQEFPEPYMRNKYTLQFLGNISQYLKIPPKGLGEVSWSPHCRIYDRWMGWIDIFCTPEQWSAVRTFVAQQQKPDQAPGFESVFSSDNAALSYYRAVNLMNWPEDFKNNPSSLISDLLTRDTASVKQLAAITKQNETALEILREAHWKTKCDLKAIIAETPDTPQPFPRDEMYSLAELWAFYSHYLLLTDRKEEALEAGLGIVKMGWDWNQGPTSYRMLGADIIDLGCRTVAKVLVPQQSRSLYQTAYDEMVHHVNAYPVIPFDSFLEEIEPYEPEALLGAEVIHEQLRMKAQESYLAIKVALAQTQVLTVQSAVFCFQYDQKVYPGKLEMIVPAYIPKIPVDPFSSSQLAYGLGGPIPRVYSIGPDAKDDYGRLPYDFHSGRVSPGDLFFP